MSLISGDENNYSKRFAFNQLKVELYALVDKRNLHLALCYFTCIYCPKLVIHSNQIKLPMASSVDYILSRMSLPFCKVLSSCTGTQNVKSIHMKCFLRVHFISLALEKTINLQTSEFSPTSLRKHNHNWIYQATMGDYANAFSVPKILRLQVQPLLSKWDLLDKVWPITLIFRMNISGLLYASYLVLLMNRINIENYLIVIRYQLF